MRSSRCISSYDHLTAAEFNFYMEYLDAKAGKPRPPIAQRPAVPLFLRPHIYHPQSSSWAALEDNTQEGLKRGSVLKIVSWNIDFCSPSPAARASAVLEHLRALFGEVPGNLVIMLQEVRRESLQAILENSWVQRNFVLTNVDPPESLYTNIAGEGFVLTQLEWDAQRYFTLMLTPRHLEIMNCFRVPFVTDMGRDALVVDLPIFNPGRRTQTKESLRLCTTHLESLWGGKAYRPGQLALISALLKGTLSMGSRIVAGLVGGDMNAIDKPEHEFHKASEVDLKDVWEDVPPPPVPVLKPFQKDLSYGRARGNTWGYQSKGKRGRKRLDKFFYTGSIEMVALSEAHDVTGRLGQFGIDLKTEVETWKQETTGYSLVRGKLVKKTFTDYHSEEIALKRLKGGASSEEELVRTKVNIWVSDHFGIGTGIKIV